MTRRLEETGAIADPAPSRYCYIVARYVFLEYLRSPEHKQSRLAPDITPGAFIVEEHNERRMACLDHCLGQLSPGDRSLILDYYQGETRNRIEQRRALAARLRLTANALTIRACRIRDKLQACVGACLSGH